MQALLTINESAQMLKVSPKTLRNWLSSKKLPFVKVGGATRLKETDIQNIIKPSQPEQKKTEGRKRGRPRKHYGSGSVERIISANIRTVTGPERKEAGQC